MSLISTPQPPAGDRPVDRPRDDRQDVLRRELARERARLHRQFGLPERTGVAHYKRSAERPFLRHQRDTTTILFGGLTSTHEALVEAMMIGLGYHAQALPAPDVRCLQLGKEYGNNGLCNPGYFTIGSLLKHLQHLRDQDGLSVDQINDQHVYMTAGACGPCRFGMYEAEFRLALRNAGFDGFRVVLFQQTAGLYQADSQAGLAFNLEFFLGLVNALVMGDWLHGTACRIRPYERQAGQTDRVLAGCVAELREALRTKPSSALRDMGLGRLAGLWPGLARRGEWVWRYLDQLLNQRYVQAMRRVGERLRRIPCDPLRVKPIVKITGEFWAQRTEGDGNFRMLRFLESEGAEALPEPIGTWIDYLIHQAKQTLQDEREVLDPTWAAGRVHTGRLSRVWQALKHPWRYARMALAGRLLRRECERLRRPVHYAISTVPDQAELERLAHPFYHSRLRGGEGHLEVGKSIYYTTRRGCHMVLSLKPFGCLPSTQSDGVQAAVVSRYPDILFLPVETAGEGQINAYSRVQMALGDARQAARHEFDTVLRQAGYARTQIERYLDRHPELTNPLGPVPHYRGVAGRAANLVLHVARLMRTQGIAPRVDHTGSAASSAGSTP